MDGIVTVVVAIVMAVVVVSIAAVIAAIVAAVVVAVVPYENCAGVPVRAAARRRRLVAWLGAGPICGHTCTHAARWEVISNLCPGHDFSYYQGGHGQSPKHGTIPGLGRALVRFRLASIRLVVKQSRLHVARSLRSCEIVACCSSSRFVHGES